MTLAGLAQNAPVGLFEADADMVLTMANPRMAEMTGISAEALVGRSLRDLLTRSSQFVYALKVEPSLLSSGGAEEIFLELSHADGRPRPALLTVTRLKAGECSGVLFAAPERRAYELELIAARQAVLAGVEEQIAANQRLEHLVGERTAALAQRDLLLREVYHRVKNNLQVVDGLLLMESRKLADPVAVGAIAGLRQRLHAIGLVHHQLMGSADLKTFDVEDFLSQLIDQLRDGAPRNVALTINAAPLAVDLDFAVPLGLLITELVTNACKHAFAGRAGEVQVSLAMADDKHVLLRVADDGVGFATDAGGQASTGLKIVQGLVRQLGGQIASTDQNGVCWEARLPVPRTPG